MSSKDEVDDRQQNRERRAPNDMAEADTDDDEQIEASWKPPERSDQAAGEETVQVNDAYTGGDAPPGDESHSDDEQHPTGG